MARLLTEYGRRIALQGSNSFYRSKAYRTRREHIAATGEALPYLIEQDALTTVPGVGDAPPAVSGTPD